jgi:HEAT repeat protein
MADRAQAGMTDLRALIERWAAAVKATTDDPPETILRPPATEAAIAALEARLGSVLPPSYRAFLAISDGADAFPGWGAVTTAWVTSGPSGLRGADDVDWIRNGDRMMVSIWTVSDRPDESASEDDHPLYVARQPERDYLLAEPSKHASGGEEKGGHIRHVLEISNCVDGYATYLNPLVLDADGEWEAWDFGTKTLGGVRHRSFRALLEADTAQLEERIAASSSEEAKIDQWVADLNDPARSPSERITAAHALFWREPVKELVVDPMTRIALDPALDLALRQSAIKVLGYAGTTLALATIATFAADPEPRLRAAALPPLAASSEPVAQAATQAMLTDPATPWFAISGIYKCSEAVWDAWLDGHDRRLIETLAQCGDERIIEPLIDALRDPGLSEQERGHLVSAASHRFRDPRLVPGVMAAAALQGPYSWIHTARTLEILGATTEAIAMLRATGVELGEQAWGQPESALGRIKDPAAGDALIAILAAKPTAPAIAALGWHPSPAAVEAIEPVLDDPELHLAGIDALETMRSAESTEALARRSSTGDVLATRALARLRDDRALEPLLILLSDPDPATAFRGADGLRDLRDPRSTDALLVAVDHADPEVAVCAAHALVSMASPRTPEALDRLAANPDEQARALASRWRTGWMAR